MKCQNYITMLRSRLIVSKLSSWKVSSLTLPKWKSTIHHCQRGHYCYARYPTYTFIPIVDVHRSFFFLSILHGSALWCECHPEHLDLIFSRKLMRYIEISGIRKELWSIRVVYSESAVQLVLTRLSKAKNGKSRFTWSLSLNLFQPTMHHWHRGTHRQHAQTLRPQGEVFCKCFLLTIFLTELFSSSNTRTNHVQSDWVRGNQASSLHSSTSSWCYSSCTVYRSQISSSLFNEKTCGYIDCGALFKPSNSVDLLNKYPIEVLS